VRFILFSISSILILAITLTAKEPVRTWTSSDGRTLEARYLEMVGTKVRIENASGRKFTIPLTGFSSADQEYVKKAYGRSLFAEPQPFEDRGRGGVIVASAKGKVEVLVAKTDRYTDPKPRNVIVGGSIASGATLTTGSGAEADLLLTNGTLAHLGENTKLVLSAIYQKSFKGNKQKASELTKEVSPSRTALKLEEGDLVLEVRKLGKESSFLISTKMAQAGIRGTQFKVSARADSAKLAVLEGRVDFLDAQQMATPVETAQKAGTRKGVPAKLEGMSTSEQAEVKQAVEQVKGASASIDLNRLANTVDGYAPKPNYVVKSALDMELIWCPPGAFIMGPGIWTPNGGEEWASPDENLPSHPVILTRGFYLGKFEVTQKGYEKVMGANPSSFKGDKLPVEMVNWNEAMAFCAALNRKEKITRGWRFTLPTEAQWEYACRSGSTTNYSWGKDHDVSKANNRAGLKTVNVGSYPPNSWGFYDLHGNVWEWTFDFRGSYKKETAYDPVGVEQLLTRVARGGSAWGKKVSAFSVAKRRANLIDRYKYRGFRVALVQTD